MISRVLFFESDEVKEDDLKKEKENKKKDDEKPEKKKDSKKEDDDDDSVEDYTTMNMNDDDDEDTDLDSDYIGDPNTSECDYDDCCPSDNPQQSPILIACYATSIVYNNLIHIKNHYAGPNPDIVDYGYMFINFMDTLSELCADEMVNLDNMNNAKKYCDLPVETEPVYNTMDAINAINKQIDTYMETLDRCKSNIPDSESYLKSEFDRILSKCHISIKNRLSKLKIGLDSENKLPSTPKSITITIDDDDLEGIDEED